MPAMVHTRYLADSGAIHPIRLRYNTAAIVGADAPGSSVTSSIQVKVSKSKRQFGLRPRGIQIGRSLVSGDITQIEYAFLPVLTPAALNGYKKEDTISYNGATWRVVSIVPENIK